MRWKKMAIIWNENISSEYNYPLFTDVWDNSTDFSTFYSNCGIPAKLSSANSITTIYYLLYAKYGNTPIAFGDEYQFKMNVMSKIFMYGPAWERELSIQDTLRGMSEADLLKGSSQMYNHANNPSNPVTVTTGATGDTPVISQTGTLTDREIGYINDQNVTINTRGKLEGYAVLVELLKKDVTNAFIDKFNELFCICAAKQRVPMFGPSED